MAKGATGVTTRLNAAVWVIDPLVPVKVIVLVVTAAALDATSWTEALCTDPVVGTLYGPEGAVVTPEGRPDIVTVTVPVKPPNGVAKMLCI